MNDVFLIESRRFGTDGWFPLSMRYTKESAIPTCNKLNERWPDCYRIVRYIPACDVPGAFAIQRLAEYNVELNLQFEVTMDKLKELVAKWREAGDQARNKIVDVIFNGCADELEQALVTLEQPPWNEGSKERQTALEEAVNHEHGPVCTKEEPHP